MNRKEMCRCGWMSLCAMIVVLILSLMCSVKMSVVKAVTTEPAPVTSEESLQPTEEANEYLTVTMKADKTSGVEVGDTITYMITIKNTGNVTVSSLALTDMKRFIVFGALDKTTIVPNESVDVTATYVVMQEDVDVGECNNTVTVSGESPSNNKADVSVVNVVKTIKAQLELEVEMTASSTEVGNEGDEIEYTVKVTNSGNVTVYSIELEISKGTLIERMVDFLAPGDVRSFRCAYIVTQDDVKAGNIENTVTVTGLDSTENNKVKYTVSVGKKYTVKFVDEDGTELQSGQVAYDTTPSYTGGTPTKKADAKYTYTFAGWTPEIKAVTGDATYTATYTSTVNKYTAKFVNEDGTELQSGQVAYDTTPSYTGGTPTKKADAQYTYTFAGWTPEIKAVTGDATYKATYTSTVNKYTVKFVNEDGTELQSSEVEYGETPSYTGNTPTKATDAQHIYTFVGWDSEIKAVVGNVTYVAKYLENANKIRVYENDGSQTYQEILFEDTISISSSKENMLFNGFNTTSIGDGNDVTSYTTTEDGTVKLNADTFINYPNGTLYKKWVSTQISANVTQVIQTDNGVIYSKIEQTTVQPEIKIVTDLTSEPEDAKIIISTSEKEDTKIIISTSEKEEAKISVSMSESKNVSLTREVKSNREEVTFLELNEPIAKMYLFDLKSKVSYDNKRTWQTEKLKESILVKPDFIENTIASATYELYHFDGEKLEQIPYDAKNNLATIHDCSLFILLVIYNKQYEVTFVDEDGTVLQKSKYVKGTSAADIVRPDDLSKEPDDKCHWKFVKWSPDIVDVAEDATYTACYEAEDHTIVIDPAIAATCTESGKTEGKHCSECGAVLKAQEEIPALGHAEVIDPAVAATCTEAGKTEGKHCSRCKAVLKAQEVIDPLGHDWDAGAETTEPTCGDDGVKTYTCRRDSSHTYTEAILAKAKQGIQKNYGTDENPITNYVHENGATCAFINGTGITWLKEDSEGSSTWYGLDNQGQFADDSIFWVRWLNKDADTQDWNEYYGKLDDEHKKLVEDDKMWIFLVGVTKANCEEYHGDFDPPVDLYIQLGTDWDEKDIRAVFISTDTDEVLDVEVISDYVLPDGTITKVAKVKLKHFSPYAVYDEGDEQKPDTDGKSSDATYSSGTSSATQSEVYKTSDAMTVEGLLGLEMFMMLALMGLYFSLKRKKI